ncbi:MAG: WYL domain-containing protein [Bacteroidales bacterium]
MAKNKINNLIWLVDIINRNGKISFADINDKWLNGDKERSEIPLRTFHNHRRDIEDMFDINIECDKSTNTYYVADTEGMLNSQLKMWLLNSFSLNNILQERIDLKRRVIFEDTPSGMQFIDPITDAMRKGFQVLVKYQTYYWTEPRDLHIEPYFLRLFHQRWYLMGVPPDISNPGVHVYALDRMQSVEITNTKFKYPRDFDPKAFYKDCFGIIKDQGVDAKRTLIKATAFQSNYLRNLPLHESQQEIDRGDEYSLFELKICPTYDLCQQLLSLGDTVEVLEPQELREKIRELVENMGQKYGVAR